MPSSTMRLRRHEAVQYYAKRKKYSLGDVNVYGAIPGVEVGDMWKTRAEMSCLGVHRPACPIVHQGPEGAYSILLAMSSRATVDEGNLFIFKGPAEKVRDKILCRACPIVNCLRLSLSSGLPIRVIRSARLKSSYSPMKGFRYDGLYKIERRWGNKSNESFLFRRIIDENQPPLEILECLSPRIPSFVQRLKQLKMDRLGRGKKLLKKESSPGNFENKSVLGEEEELTSFEEEQDFYEEERECSYDKENEDEINWTEIKREYVFVAEGGGNEIAGIGKGEEVEEEEEVGETTLTEEYEDVFEEEVVDVKMNNLVVSPAPEEEILPTQESCEPPDRPQEERIFLLNDVTEISSVVDENEFQEENVPFKREFKNFPQMVEGYEERTVFVEDEEDPLLACHEKNVPPKSPSSKEFVDIKPKKKMGTPTNSASKGDMNYNMYFVCPNVCRCRYNLSMRDVINIISGSGVCPCTWEKQPEYLEGEVALILKHLARHKSQVDECIQKGEHLDISGPNPNLAIRAQQLDSVILRLMFFLVNASYDDKDVSDFVRGSGPKEKLYKKKHCLKNLRKKGINVAARKLIFPKKSKKRHTKHKSKNLKVSVEETSDFVVKETISQKNSEVPFEDYSVDRLEGRSEEDPFRLDDLSESNLSIVGTVSIGNNFNENVVWEKYDEMRLNHLEPSLRRDTPRAGISSTDSTEPIRLQKPAKGRRGRKAKLVDTSEKTNSSYKAPRLGSGTSNDQEWASWEDATPRRGRKKKSETVKAKSQSSKTQSFRISDHPQSHRIRSVDGVPQPKKMGRKKKTLNKDGLTLRERHFFSYSEDYPGIVATDDELVRRTPKKRGRKKKDKNGETESLAENIYKTVHPRDQYLGMSSRVKEGLPFSVPKKKRGRKKKSIDTEIRMFEESTHSLFPILRSPTTTPSPKRHRYLSEDENVQLSYNEEGDSSHFRGFFSVGAVTKAKLNRLKCYLERKEPFHGFPPDRNYRGMGHLIALRLFLQKLRKLDQRIDRTMWMECGQMDNVSASRTPDVELINN